MAAKNERVLILFCLFAASINLCNAEQKSKPSPSPAVDAKGHKNNGDETRPQIFQTGQGQQSLQLAISSKTPSAHVSAANFRVPSGEELQAMEQILQAFESAFENLSLVQIRQIWPNLDRQHETSFKNVFSAFRQTSWSRRLELECNPPKIAGETANVDCRETLLYGAAKGKPKQVGPARVAIILKKQASTWVFADMKGTD